MVTDQPGLIPQMADKMSRAHCAQGWSHFSKYLWLGAWGGEGRKDPAVRAPAPCLVALRGASCGDHDT